MAAQIRKDDQSSDSSLSDRDDNDWEDAEPDEEQIQVIGLFDDVVFSNAQTMLGYCKEKYDFDFVAVQKQHSQFGSILCVLIII
jgi:protein arginine N-methyltransferase 3